MHFNRLKELRKACDLTQQQVADIIGVERSTYTYYEKGKSNPTIENALRLAKLFQLPFEEVFDEKAVLREGFELYNYGNDSTEIAPEMYVPQLTKEEKMMVLNYRLLNDEEKEKIYQEVVSLNGGASV